MATQILVDEDGCIFDAALLSRSHGWEDLSDPVAMEAFVNHVHVAGDGCKARAESLIRRWIEALQTGWPKERFRLYRDRSDEESEVIVRFHMVRAGLPNWAEQGCEIIEIGPKRIGDPGARE